MSGQRIVPLLQVNKDIFLHGAAVKKLMKTTGSDDKGTNNKSSSVAAGKDGEVAASKEIVLCVSSTYKILQKPRPPAPPTPPPEPAAATGEVDDEEEEKMKKREKKKPPQPPMPRPTLVWRMPHCYITRVAPLTDQELRMCWGSSSPPSSPAAAFAVFFLTTKPPKKKAMVKSTTKSDDCGGNPLLAAVADGCKCFGGQTSTTDVCLSQCRKLRLRCRVYQCVSAFERDDWCNLYEQALMNYWHGRLEEALIPSPDVFQFQTMMCLNLTPLSKGDSGGGVGGGDWAQAVLSTSACYVIPRSSPDEVESPSPAGGGAVMFFDVADLVHCGVDKARGIVLLEAKDGIKRKGKSSSSSQDVLKLGFVSSHEGVTFVVELQRIWDLVQGNDVLDPSKPMPFTVVA